MPKIPTFTSTALPPGVSGTAYAPLDLTARPYAAAARGLMGITSQLQRMDERMRLARQSTELGNAQVGAMKDLSEVESGFASRTDFENFEPEFRQHLDTLRTRYREQIKDPEVYRAFARDFERQALRTEINVRSMARKREIDHGRASYRSNIQELSLMYGRTGDEDKKLDILNRVKVLTAGAVTAGYMTEESGVSALHNFVKSADTAEAMEDLRRDPVTFDAADYPGLDKETQILLQDQALQRMKSLAQEHARAVEQAEQEAEKAHQAQIDEADYAAWQSFSNKQLTLPDLEDMATRREISEQTYRAIRKAMEPDAEKIINNPVVVGDLAGRVAMGLDVRPQLKEALNQGQIQAQTYIQMSTRIADKEYARGMAYIAHALQPTAADHYSADRHLRYAEAVDHYNSLVEQGISPVNAGKEVVQGYMSDIRRTRKGLPKPKYLTGSKTSWEHLDRAEQATVQAFRNHELTPQEYDREINTISELKKIAERETDMGSLTEEQKRRIRE